MLKLDDFALRPMLDIDKDLILAWRNSERVRRNMYTDHLITQQEHDAWFTRASKDAKSAYFVFLHQDKPIGFVSFTNIDNVHGRCYWAFYLGETDVPRGCGAAMEYLALDHAFSVMKIRKLCCEVFAFNSAVIKMHQKFGFIQEGRLAKHHLKNGQYEDIVCLAKFASDWETERTKLKQRIFKN